MQFLCRHFLKRSVLLLGEDRTDLLSLHLGSGCLLCLFDSCKFVGDDKLDYLDFYAELLVLFVFISQQRFLLIYLYLAGKRLVNTIQSLGRKVKQILGCD